ncbi:MAG TPA: low molecular weight protein-tyrosine-phosphatase [Sporosarcina sp.]|nr:low molecular weight protein-tyrosine-phosphatase [Sporosarcina sp.]
MVRVLFVCLGNICRSPMAEAIFRQKVKAEGLDHLITVDSAGTGDWHIGNRPHDGTLQKLEQYAISSEGMVARQLTADDDEQFDYIIGMDANNVRDIRDVFGTEDEAKVFRLLDITNNHKDVPDPYFTGDFDETYALLTEGCDRLLEKIKEEHHFV